jgi:hypothetical protein
MAAVPPPVGPAQAGARREGERRREQSRRAGAGAIAPLSSALAGARRREAGGSKVVRWRRRARVRGRDVARFDWSTRTIR